MKTKNDIIYYIINYIYYIKQIQLKILNNKIIKKMSTMTKLDYYDMAVCPVFNGLALTFWDMYFEK